MNAFDKIIIGAGIYGLYAALLCIKKGERVLVLEYDDAPFLRASWINQARVHNGYHYPRSYSTAVKSAYYFDRFVEDFGFAIAKKFKKIYATSTQFSYTNALQFEKFCTSARIPCDPIAETLYFKENMCDGAYETLEYSFDAQLIGAYLLKELSQSPNFSIQFQTRINSIVVEKDEHVIATQQAQYRCPFLINATYASLNQILHQCGLELFKLKYELCEVALCKVSKNIKNVGITVMDGPFFSLMPFGKTGYHSLTAVDYTPHLTSYAQRPTFPCQDETVPCTPLNLANCNYCKNKPKSAFTSMYKLARKYLHDNITIDYQESLFAMKAILQSAEVNDARPTIIKVAVDAPKFLSLFSGKINAIYDLHEVL